MENNLNNFVSLYVARIIVAKKNCTSRLCNLPLITGNYVILNEIDAHKF